NHALVANDHGLLLGKRSVCESFCKKVRQNTAPNKKETQADDKKTNCGTPRQRFANFQREGNPEQRQEHNRPDQRNVTRLIGEVYKRLEPISSYRIQYRRNVQTDKRTDGKV